MKVRLVHTAVMCWEISDNCTNKTGYARTSRHGGNISGPTEEELRQIEARQKAREERCEEYACLNEESALKRRLMEQEADERYYKTSTAKKAVSIAAYEAAGILK